VLDPEVVSQLMGATRRPTRSRTLSPREREVLSLMAEGRSNAAIAGSLFLSAGAVEKHVTSIFTKLGLPRRPVTTAGCSRCCATSNPDPCPPDAARSLAPAALDRLTRDVGDVGD